MSNEKKPLYLKVGKRYVFRDGTVSEPLKSSMNNNLVLGFGKGISSMGLLYMKRNKSGIAYVYNKDEPHKKDIVAEYKEEKS